MDAERKDHDPPLAIDKWGWRYHHLGIPTQCAIEDEIYLSEFKLNVGGFKHSPYGIEWMRFEADSPVHQLIKTVPHIAFEVHNLDLELSLHNFKIITPPNAPSQGLRVAMIEHNGAPVELIEFNYEKVK